MSKKVYLSPSMQENNVGVGSYGTEEVRMNQIADITQKVLESNGITVYRNKPDWSLTQMVNDSNAKQPDIHVAIHSNAGGGCGCEVWCYPGYEKDKRLAQNLYTEVEAITPTPDRGIKFSTELYELKKTKATAALIEVAFHDHPSDATWMVSSIKEIGGAIANGILKHFDIKPTQTDEFEQVIEVLVKAGILTSPEYWLANARPGKTVDGAYAGIILNRMAERLEGGDK